MAAAAAALCFVYLGNKKRKAIIAEGTDKLLQKPKLHLPYSTSIFRAQFSGKEKRREEKRREGKGREGRGD